MESTLQQQFYYGVHFTLFFGQVSIIFALCTFHVLTLSKPSVTSVHVEYRYYTEYYCVQIGEFFREKKILMIHDHYSVHARWMFAVCVEMDVVFAQV